MTEESKTIKAITEFLFIGKPLTSLDKYDLLIVLGNDDVEGTVQEILTLQKGGKLAPNCHIILSGNVGSLNQGKAPEADRLFIEATKHGLPENLFWIERQATNALENFRYSKEIIESHGGFDHFSSILCVGRAFMMRRALMCASACNYPAEKLEFYGTVDIHGRNIGNNSWWKSESARIRVLEEISRIAKYTLAGDISID